MYLSEEYSRKLGGNEASSMLYRVGDDFMKREKLVSKLVCLFFPILKRIIISSLVDRLVSLGVSEKVAYSAAKERISYWSPENIGLDEVSKKMSDQELEEVWEELRGYSSEQLQEVANLHLTKPIIGCDEFRATLESIKEDLL